MFRTTPKRLWRSIIETANPEARTKRLGDVRALVEQRLNHLSEREREYEAAQAALAFHPGNAEGIYPKIAALTTLALILVAVDLPLQYLLNRLAFGQLPEWSILLASPAIALGLGAIIHAVVIAFIHDEDRPARSLRICRVLAGVALMTATTAASVFAFARQASPEVVPHIVTLTSISIWVLAETLPVTGGVFSAWAYILAAPRLVARRLRAVRRATVEWEDLRKQLSSEAERIRATGGGRWATSNVRGADGRPNHAGPARRIITTFLLSILSSAGLPSPGAAGPMSGVTATTNASQYSLFAGGGRASEPQEPQLSLRVADRRVVCSFMTDVTRSVDPQHRSRATELLLAVLPAIVSQLDCSEVVVGSFSDEGAFSPRRRWQLPERPAHLDCSEVKAATSSGTQRALLGIQGFQQYFHRVALAECQAGQSELVEAFQNAQTRVLEGVAGVLSRPQLESESRTNIVDVALSLRHGQPERHIFLLTDGLDTAHADIPNLCRGAERAGVTTTLILVPARSKYGGVEATVAAAERWAEAGIGSIPYTALVEADGVLGIRPREPPARGPCGQ